MSQKERQRLREKSKKIINPKTLPSQLGEGKRELEQKTRGGRCHRLWSPTAHPELAEEEGSSAGWGPSAYTAAAAGGGRQAGRA